MYFLADFSASGKTITKRLNNALDTLKGAGKNLTEGSFLFNPKTGKTGKYVKGSDKAVAPFIQQKTQPKVDRWVLHNHPTNTSLSLADLNATKTKQQIFAKTATNSTYRGYRLKDDPIDGKYVTNSMGYAARKLPYREAELVASHANNLRLRDKGDIFYRAKLGKVDNKIIERNKQLIDDIRNDKGISRLKLTDVEETKMQMLEDNRKLKNHLELLERKNIKKGQITRSRRKLLDNNTYMKNYKNIIKDQRNLINDVKNNKDLPDTEKSKLTEMIKNMFKNDANRNINAVKGDVDKLRSLNLY